MAEYQEVVKQFMRMCNTYTRHNECPMCPACNIGQCRKIAFERSGEFEGRVMAWAAAHPEPVYPTWGEYIRSVTGLDPVEVNGMRLALTRRIPTDIAKKLGVKPKDVER